MLEEAELPRRLAARADTDPPEEIGALPWENAGDGSDVLGKTTKRGDEGPPDGGGVIGSTADGRPCPSPLNRLALSEFLALRLHGNDPAN